MGARGLVVCHPGPQMTPPLQSKMGKVEVVGSNPTGPTSTGRYSRLSPFPLTIMSLSLPRWIPSRR